MTMLRSICVYCGSAEGKDPEAMKAAHRLGADIAAAGLRLIYGGGNIGLMGGVARSVIEHGGKVTGIIPTFLQRRENMLTAVDDLIVTKDMHERKRLMFEHADAFVALPGGIGTLEELVEQLTWAQLGQHRKPILLANIGGFWSRFVDLLDHMHASGFIRPDLPVHYHVIDKIEDIVPTASRLLAERRAEELVMEIDAAKL